MDTQVIGGVDTHAATHCAAVITTTGALIDVATFPASRSGYEQLAQWLAGHGTIRSVGIEGTGAYGAGLARYLRGLGIDVVEVPRPHRRLRRRHGKSDPIDAEAAARAVLAGPRPSDRNQPTVPSKRFVSSRSPSTERSKPASLRPTR